MSRNPGQFKPGQSGNPAGKPKGCKNKFSLKEFYAALEIVEAEKGVSFLEHCIMRAYVDNTVAVALLRKLLPDLKQVTATLERHEGLYAAMTPDEAAAAMDVDTMGDPDLNGEPDANADETKDPEPVA